MAVLYEFERPDSKRIGRFFPMGKCPQQILCEDGVVAQRIYSCGYVGSSQFFGDRRRQENLNAAKHSREVYHDLIPKIQT